MRRRRTDHGVQAVSNKTASQLVAEAKASVENLTPDQVRAEMAAGALLVGGIGDFNQAARVDAPPKD